MSSEKLARKKISKWESCGWSKEKQLQKIRETEQKSRYGLGPVMKDMKQILCSEVNQ